MSLHLRGYWLAAVLPLIAVGFGSASAAGNAARNADEPPAAAARSSDATSEPDAETKTEEKSKWVSLFDGKTLKGWKVTKFGGEGDVHVRDGQLILEMGADMTGVTATQPVPRINYEVELDAMRVKGSDFFCGLTFPVKKDYCSLILGGWGGGVCGLSSINGFDASENSTTTYQTFKTGRWYHVRLRVTESHIQAWLDGEQIVNQEITDQKVSTRVEVELSKPFGFATWNTTGALKNIRLRKLSDKEAAQAPADESAQ